MGAQRRAYRHHHATGMQNAVKQHREYGPVGQHEAYPVAGP
jgi:hypothetical protein